MPGLLPFPSFPLSRVGHRRSRLGIVSLGRLLEADPRGSGLRREGAAFRKRTVGREGSHRGLNKGGCSGCACAQRRRGRGCSRASSPAAAPAPALSGGEVGNPLARPRADASRRAAWAAAAEAAFWGAGSVLWRPRAAAGSQNRARAAAPHRTPRATGPPRGRGCCELAGRPLDTGLALSFSLSAVTRSRLTAASTSGAHESTHLSPLSSWHHRHAPPHPANFF
ncbi:putative uncharacterized protein encoded by MAPKAPK5-AS1 [Pan paniscus]|uniref:putative uncharacterized protein encoded by MAPKAPK5-AS1 n=1 Tax=Pan paniscus TaxID=9597 RepID=UPI003005999F